MPPNPLGFMLLMGCAGWGQTSPISAVSRTILEAVEANHALEMVERVHSSDRWFTFPKFQVTAGYLKSALQTGGLRDVEMGALAADGKTQVGFWTAPLAWDAQQATLDVVAPTQVRLCDYQKVPACVGMWSSSTPANGVEAELVDMDVTPLAQMRGKFVLTSMNSAGVKSKLVQHGALGAVNGFSENPELLDDRQWINAWGDYGWGFLQSSTPLLSYSITPRQAKQLRELLAAGKRVVLRAKAATRLYAGEYPWVTAVLPGTDPGGQEVLALAHTSEQGAHDNATGVAASMEALFTLRRLVETGKLPRPRRTIRVLLMPELYGSLSYISRYPERMARTVAAITVDTPAASYDLAGTEYTLYKNPHVAKSWADALMYKVARATLPRRRPFHVAEHTTGTDAYLGDPTIGVPNVWIYSGTGVTTHHNSADIPATEDVRSPGDVTAMVAADLYIAASAGSAEVPWLASILLGSATEELNSAAGVGLDALLAGDRAAASFALARLDYLAERNADAIRSLRRLLSGKAANAADAHIHSALKQLQGQLTVQKGRFQEHAVTAYTRPAAVPDGALVVRRKRVGTIPLDDLPAERREGFPSGAWDKMVTVALYWCDGKRTVDEVARLTEMEMGRPLSFPFPSYFRFLERHGYVEFAE